MNPDLDDREKRLAIMRENIGMIAKAVPWGRELGFEFTRVEQGHIWGRQPWAEKLVGNPETGVIHGGVITTFLDNLCGAACGTALKEFRFVATLDLRIDYLQHACRNYFGNLGSLTGSPSNRTRNASTQSVQSAKARSPATRRT